MKPDDNESERIYSNRSLAYYKVRTACAGGSACLAPFERHKLRASLLVVASSLLEQSDSCPPSDWELAVSIAQVSDTHCSVTF